MAATDTSALTEGVHRLMPLAATLGLEMVSNSPEQVTARLAWSPSLCTTGEIMHGGAIMALADSTGGLCAFNNLPEGASGTSTIESKTNFLRAVRADYVEAVSRPLHVGRTVIVIETDVRRPDGSLAARVTQSQAVLRS
jgi:1,4-dihydroxy-2-naphthoyl-CoA hydrolase